MIELNTRTAVRWLAEAGISSREWVTRELVGGVSSTVILADDGLQRVVLKQALAKLKVADDWRAPRRRLLTEAAALQVAGAITPGRVPSVIRVDGDNYIIAIDAAPPDWRPWKQELLTGVARSWTVETLAGCLARWHDGSFDDPAIAGRFDDPEAFDQLRLSPYYRTVAARMPEVADALDDLIGRTQATSTCLVHGDFSPKNVLVGNGALWVLDWEVAHMGDPSFDVAFLVSHLLLKSLHTGSEEIRRSARAFSASYEQGLTRIAHDRERTRRHLGALLLSRVYGKSPVEYLSVAQREQAAELGRRLLDPGSVLDDAWSFP